ncbi:MAG: Xaa-Pro peptidase family protein [Treponemataceae bacterium]|nr:Xaa-Pro peptidase family protein [Treponemataceae bacterium]
MNDLKDLEEIYKSRRANLCTWMAQNSIGMVLIEDSEANRNPALRYFCGLPSDGILGISINGLSILSPWDENLAAKIAFADIVAGFNQFNRSATAAAAAIAEMANLPAGARIEISPATAYPRFLQFVDKLNKYDVLCRDNGAFNYITRLRACKDKAEIELTQKAAEFTGVLIDQIEQGLRDGSIKTETDVALLIERAAHSNGCENTGFDTLAAGPARSFGIHCFPGYTDGDFGSDGLSILDFGLIYGGYTSDVTITVARGELTEQQQTMLDLVQKAYDTCLNLYKPGLSIKAAAEKAQSIFAKEKMHMPHGLGHGIGLQIHEWPFVKETAGDDEVFEKGMIVTLEPGLYDPVAGGVRLENDVLITEDGNQVLTRSKIIRL